MPIWDPELDIGVLPETPHVQTTWHHWGWLPSGDLNHFEHRGDRAYDQQTTSKIIAEFGGRRVIHETDDRQLANVIAREILWAGMTRNSTGHHPCVYEHPFREGEIIRGR